MASILVCIWPPLQPKAVLRAHREEIWPDRRCVADLGVHKAGRDIGYCHLEKLHNLEALPAHGFFISCFPHKIRGASAGWTRAVAIFDDKLMAA